VIRRIARHQQCAHASTDIWERFVQNRHAIVAFPDPRATLISTVALIMVIALLPVMAVVLCATQAIACRHRFANVRMVTRESIAPKRLATRATMDPLAALIKTAAWDTRIAVRPATAIANFATKRIAHRNQSVSAPTDTQDYTVRNRLRGPSNQSQTKNRSQSLPHESISLAIVATPDRIAINIKIVVQDVRIAVERDMVLVHYAIQMIVHRRKSANVRMDIGAKIATIRPTRDCVVM